MNNKDELDQSIPQKSALALKEEEILAFWQEKEIFKKSLEKPSPKGNFIFYDGPPFATGLPHYGHMLPGTIKDVIPRFKTMQGYHVPRKWGWDTHGLPIENLIEKELGLKNKKDIEDLGIGKFNEAARASVLRYETDWKNIIPRTGRWVDMDNPYITMDSNYTESIWWSFKTLYDKNLIYQGYKVMYLCPRCETSLSNFEVTQGYKDITDISVYVKFELVDEPGTYVLAWTTTPWTLPGNVALAINPETLYVKVKSQDNVVILAKERLSVLKEEYSVLEELTGKELVGKKYKPVFDYYQHADFKGKENAWKIYGAEFVTTEDGTGVVHIAPAYGEDDYKLSAQEGFPVIHHVGSNGQFKKEVTDLVGQSAKPKDDHQKADVEIIKLLAAKKALFAKEKIMHSYPHCWRCDTPLLNYATDSWFVNVTIFKEKLVANNQKVKWTPKEVGEGRFGKWLENARDWAISRSRYWGATLPVWICTKCERKEVIGSVEELAQKSGKQSKNSQGERDLHRPYIDEVSWECSCGGTFKRVPEVFDTWYESGSMPYASLHYPFENKEKIDRGTFFPADFIAEGQDQTRGWFYSLLVLSSALFDTAPFKSVVVNGIVLAEDGQKMSKRLKNYPELHFVFDKYGADALRYYLLASPAVRAEDLFFSEKGLDEVVKKIIAKLENVYTFYKTYQAEEIEVKGRPESKHVLDRWIIARLDTITEEITSSLEKYELDRAARPFMNFIDDFSTWYIRRSRDRFKGNDLQDKQYALQTTRYVLLELAKLTAPFMPFMAEHMFQKVKGKDAPESVHLESWPELQTVDTTILSDMNVVRALVSLALESRSKAGIKVRQPLAKLTIKNREIATSEAFADLIKDEVNVKEVTFDESLEGEILLDARISDVLKREGQAREFIRALQDMRKKAGLYPQNMISLYIDTTDSGKSIVEEFKNEIMKTTQVTGIVFKDCDGETVSVDDLSFKVKIIQ